MYGFFRPDRTRYRMRYSYASPLHKIKEREVTYYLLLSFCAHMVGQEPECTEPYVMRDYETGRKEVYSSKDSCKGAKTSAAPLWGDALRLTNQDKTRVRATCLEVK